MTAVRVRTTGEDHAEKCLRGWQRKGAEWDVRLCEHDRVQRWEPVGRGKWFWRDLSRIEHPILWRRARRALVAR